MSLTPGLCGSFGFFFRMDLKTVMTPLLSRPFDRLQGGIESSGGRFADFVDLADWWVAYLNTV